jgi:AAA15 family ATPase/GTPase
MRIKKFSIKNYRSLKEISIDEFDSTTIFYGDNNAGKSNILNALELIFKRKQILDQDGLTAPQTFLNGDIPDSKNNFFNNETNSPITFNVGIEVDFSELLINRNIEQVFSKGNNLFSFSGKIVFIEGTGDYSEMKIEEISVNTTVIYEYKSKVEYFPSIKQTSNELPELATAFANLINVFNDCFYIVSSDRDMHEVSINDEIASNLSPKTFKKYLYNLYLSRQKFHLFEEINKVFSEPPFSYGTISFSEEPDHKLELMVKEGGFRLPIKHLGSGVLQSLYIITAIIESRKKIVCVEELEQNLSPKKQYEILRKIQSMIVDPQMVLDQLIISSHSAVYAKPRLGDIYFLVKEGGRTTLKSLMKKISKSKKGITELPIDKDFKEHLAPNEALWTDEDLYKYIRREHDFEPFSRPESEIKEDSSTKGGPKLSRKTFKSFEDKINTSDKRNRLSTPKKPESPKD